MQGLTNLTHADPIIYTPGARRVTTRQAPLVFCQGTLKTPAAAPRGSGDQTAPCPVTETFTFAHFRLVINSEERLSETAWLGTPNPCYISAESHGADAGSDALDLLQEVAL